MRNEDPPALLGSALSSSVSEVSSPNSLRSRSVRERCVCSLMRSADVAEASHRTSPSSPFLPVRSACTGPRMPLKMGKGARDGRTGFRGTGGATEGLGKTGLDRAWRVARGVGESFEPTLFTRLRYSSRDTW